MWHLAVACVNGARGGVGVADGWGFRRPLRGGCVAGGVGWTDPPPKKAVTLFVETKLRLLGGSVTQPPTANRQPPTANRQPPPTAHNPNEDPLTNHPLLWTLGSGVSAVDPGFGSQGAAKV